MTDCPAVLALDIGGTKLAVGIVDMDGRTHYVEVISTKSERGPADVLRRLFNLGHVAMTRYGPDKVRGVGIACGGPLDTVQGVLTGPLHLPGWVDVPIVTLARREFDRPVVLENDATAGALGEYRFGAGRGTATMVFLTISTGIGGGAVVEHRLHRGAAGNGGEFGHLIVKSDGLLCLCGRRGCLEAYASGSSIAARTAEALTTFAGRSTLAALDGPGAEDVARQARRGDDLATLLWEETTAALGTALTTLVNLFEPQLVVLGGGVSRSGEQLLGPVREQVAREAMPPAAKAARIVPTELGDLVCVVGAGAAALEVLDHSTDRRKESLHA